LASRRNGEIQSFHPVDRKAWRAWLTRNHGSAEGVWLVVLKKNSGKAGVHLEEAVEEAVCFGWIDSKLNVADVNSFRLLFTPRKPGSIWSKSNKQRVEKLIQQGLMTEAGLEKVEAAKQDGSWNRIDTIDELRLPEDLRRTLAADSAAQKNFDAFSDSAKKMILWWIESAKKNETRQKRIQQAVASSAQNKKPFLS
jgi:uncharacterized protein YdeI (YjbR/CyaY-like superfamily)